MSSLDPCFEVRDKFTKKLHKGEDLLKLPLEYLGIFALAAPEPIKERRNQVKQMIAKNVKTRRDYLKQHSSAQACSHSILPEYALPCVIHMLAHHPDFKRDHHETLVQFRDFLKKLVENVKQTRDAQAPDDEEVNKNLYTVCDLTLGLILNKVHSFVLKEFPGNPVLPKKFFIPSEKDARPNTKSYLPKGFQFTSAKGQKKAVTVESVPSKTSKQAARNKDKKLQAKSQGRKEQKTKSSKTSKIAFKAKLMEIEDDDDEGEDSGTQESGFASPVDEHPSPRKRGRPPGSSVKMVSKKPRQESSELSSKESSSSPSKQKAIKGSRQSPRKKPSSSPSDSPSRQFSRQELESDVLPEDDQTRDSGTSSLDSPKKPFSSRQLTEHNDRTKSAKQVNGLGGAEDSDACQSKKAKILNEREANQDKPRNDLGIQDQDIRHEPITNGKHYSSSLVLTSWELSTNKN
ncbi:Sister chromatid cohesion protein PDS5-like protein B [Acropora cervicornis]|uniref:Sister chromatid cohesion protein PDS5-like protein B n=1 Tax=Acropora cervicornis TaxID=6130 RepID=A0AAD9Q0M1_ACRCE|nr:Sister chromatid cohesion protein PDS5-like protein B [Acropora cervicornis]